MADEVIKPDNSAEMAALKAEVERLRKSNSEILDDYKKAKEAAKAVPQDVDVNALIAFKQKKEQEELEAKDRYEEATEQLASKFREAEEQQKQTVTRSPCSPRSPRWAPRCSARPRGKPPRPRQWEPSRTGKLLAEMGG